MKDSLRMFGKMSLRVAAFLVLIFPVYFLTLPAETEVYRQNHKPVSMTQTKQEIGPDFVVRVNASSDETICDKAIDDTGNWTQDPDLALFKTEANKRGLSCAGWIPKHLRGKWGIESVDEEAVVVSVNGEVVAQDKFRIVLKKGSCDDGYVFTTFYSAKNHPQINELEKKRIGARLMGVEGELLVLFSKPFSFGHTVFVSMNSGSIESIKGFFGQRDSISLDLFDTDTLKASDYFDSKANKWNTANLAATLDKAHKICNLSGQGAEKVDQTKVAEPNEKNLLKKAINLNGSGPSPAKLTGVMSLKGDCTISRISQTQTSCRDRIIHTSYDTSRIGFYFLSDTDQQDLLIVAYSGLAIASQKPSSDARIQPIDMLIVSGEIIKGSGECYFENPYGGNKARIECDFQSDKGIRYSNYFMTDGQKPDIVEIPTG